MHGGSNPSTAAYGRLSVMLQWRYAMENVLAVPPESFLTPPRVDSVVVRIGPAPRTGCVGPRDAGRAGASGLQPAAQAAAPHPGSLARCAWLCRGFDATASRGSAGGALPGAGAGLCGSAS